MLGKRMVGVVAIVAILGATTAQADKVRTMFGVTAALIGAAVYIDNLSKTDTQIKADEKKKQRAQRAKKRYKKKVVVVTEEMKIQSSLTSLGFYKGKVDGNMNSYQTRTAIKTMNKEFNISETSVLGEKEKNNLLFLSSLFKIDGYLNPKKETKRSSAKRLQASLLVHGTYSGKIDGSLGKKSRTAVAEYKNNLGLNGKQKLQGEEKFELINTAIAKNTDSIESVISLMVVKEEFLQVLANEHLAQEEAAPKEVKIVSQEESTHTMSIDIEEDSEMKPYEVAETKDNNVVGKKGKKMVAMLDKKVEPASIKTTKAEPKVEARSFSVPDED